MTGRLSSLHGARHNGIPLSRDHTTFVELLKDAGYKTGLIGKSHLQSFTGLPATNKYEPDASLTTPSDSLRDFYGLDHVEIAADHADAASGDYLLWARSQNPDFDHHD